MAPLTYCLCTHPWVAHWETLRCTEPGCRCTVFEEDPTYLPPGPPAAGTVGYAIGLYHKVRQRQRALAKAEGELAAWLRTLTPAEWDAYAMATACTDAAAEEEP